jgi:hypothetical protein
LQWTPSELQTPDWHTVGPVCAVQPDWPSARPHSPLTPQYPFTHCVPVVQGEPGGSAQVFVVGLHVPLKHMIAWFATVHEPWPAGA